MSFSNRRTNGCPPQALTDGKEGGKTQDPEEHKLLKRLTEELKSSTDGEHKPDRLSSLLLHKYKLMIYGCLLFCSSEKVQVRFGRHEETN